MELQQLIPEAWNNRELLKDAKYSHAVKAVIEELDKGRLRTASPTENAAISSLHTSQHLACSRWL